MAYKYMSADDIRSAVRDITDLDSTDLPDSILDLYIRDGYYRILDVEKRWSWLEITFNLTTRTGVREYSLADLSDEPVAQISSIVDNTAVGNRLDMVGFDEAEHTYSGSYDVSGNPLFYAFWGGSVHLYPKPNNVRTLVCRGYREPYDWVTEDGQVDASASLHFPLVYYAVSRVYQQLEDAQMSAMYKQAFDEGVSLAARNINKPNSHYPLVLSGSRTSGRPTYRTWLQGLGRNLGQ